MAFFILKVISLDNKKEHVCKQEVFKEVFGMMHLKEMQIRLSFIQNLFYKFRQISRSVLGREIFSTLIYTEVNFRSQDINHI